MNKYNVKVSYMVWDVYEVEAANEDEAISLAQDKADETSLNEMNCEACSTIIVE